MPCRVRSRRRFFRPTADFAETSPMKPVIVVENLAKSYQITHAGARGGYRTLRESIAGAITAPFRRARFGRDPSGAHVGDGTNNGNNGNSDGRDETFWALSDVSFEVQPGEVVGIIGRNGAGKSTLLKILSRITKPTRGQVTLRGRLGSLLEVGTGFHPELTGRENIYLNGSIIGMGRREIDRKFDQIVDFSGVEKFLDTPVKRYSSGMYVRLAFAVAAHLDPEILLVDEVLAVGDQAFQKKCLGRMGEIAAGGRTVLLVSHNLPMLTNLCSRAVWLNQGRVQASGEPAEIIGGYCRETAVSSVKRSSASLLEHPGRSADSRVMLQNISLFNDAGEPTCAVALGRSLTAELRFAALPRRSQTNVIMDICDEFGTVVARCNSRVQSAIDFSLEPVSSLRCSVRDLRLLPGSYVLNLAIGDGSAYLDRIEGAIRFTIEPVDLYGTGLLPVAPNGLFALDARWEIVETGEGTSAGAALGDTALC
jgi:lipopolysaccharide transport system ATP-binding protein